MPNTLFANVQDEVTVIQSVVRDVIKQIVHDTGFPDDTEIVFAEPYQGGGRQLANMVAPCDAKFERTDYNNFVFVTYKDRFTEEGVMYNRPKEIHHQAIFQDTELGIFLFPMYTVSRLEMELRFRARDLTQLNGWRNRIRINHGLQELIGFHQVRYDASIPYGVLDFMGDAYEMRENVAGYGDDLSTWMKSCASPGISTRRNINESHIEVIYNEIQHGVQGMADESQFYNSIEIQNGIYECSFTYTFQFEKLTGFSFYWPLTIHNQQVPRRFIDAWIPTARAHETRGMDTAYFHMEQPLGDREVAYFYNGDGGQRFVPYDDWFPEMPTGLTKTVLISPIRVDLMDNMAVFSLEDFSADLLPPAVLAYMRKYNHLQANPHESLVAIEIFAVGGTERRLPFTIDANLNIRTRIPMDPRQRHYLRVSLFQDLAIFNSLHTKELLRDAAGSYELFKLYDHTLELTTDAKWYKETFPGILEGGKRYRDLPSRLLVAGNEITPLSYTIWIRRLADTNMPFILLEPKTERSSSDGSIGEG